MTQEQADTLIKEWQHRIAVVTENLLALDDTLTMKRIEGRGGFTMQPLTGGTSARVVPAVAAMRQLFGQVGAICDVVERADRARRSLNRLWRYGETLAEIESLLTGPSISLPETSTPLAERNLLTSSTRADAVTPEHLLTAMTNAYAAARDAVLAVEAAWERWERIVRLFDKHEAAARQKAVDLGLPVPPELIQFQAQIDELRRQVASDPLGVTGVKELALAQTLIGILATIDRNRHGADVAATRLRDARDLYRELTGRKATISRSFDDCRSHLLTSSMRSGESVPSLREMEEWLTSLEALNLGEHWQSIGVGVARWTEAALTIKATLEKAERTNLALLALPAELRGRLTVLRTRMRMLNRPDDVLSRLSQQANALLDEHPPSVDRAAKLVEACEARFRAQIVEGVGTK